MKQCPQCAFTDAEFKPTMTIPEAKGGGVGDLANALTGNRSCSPRQRHLNSLVKGTEYSGP